MTTAVVVPFTGTDVHRLRAWGWVEARYRTLFPEWEIVTGTYSGPFCKALAVADALTNTDADLLIVADADCWSETTGRIVEQVATGQFEWGAPHRRVIRLNKEATEQVYRDGLPDTMPNAKQLAERVFDESVFGGGIVVLPRTLYERVPLDPRFQGWGSEDVAWGLALKRLTHQFTRGHDVAWHLWHDPQPRKSRKFGNDENAALLARYERAVGDKHAMETLIEEAKCSQASSPKPS